MWLGTPAQGALAFQPFSEFRHQSFWNHDLEAGGELENFSGDLLVRSKRPLEVRVEFSGAIRLLEER
jgi:hypothetical protein